MTKESMCHLGVVDWRAEGGERQSEGMRARPGPRDSRGGSRLVYQYTAQGPRQTHNEGACDTARCWDRWKITGEKMAQ